MPSTPPPCAARSTACARARRRSCRSTRRRPSLTGTRPGSSRWHAVARALPERAFDNRGMIRAGLVPRSGSGARVWANRAWYSGASGDVLFDYLWAEAKRSSDPHAAQVAALEQLVDRGRAQAEAGGDGAHGYQPLVRALIRRKLVHHRRTKWRLIRSALCQRVRIGAITLSCNFRRLRPAATRCQPIDSLLRPFGTRGSQVRILSPRLTGKWPDSLQNVLRQIRPFSCFKGGRPEVFSHDFQCLALNAAADGTQPGGPGFSFTRKARNLHMLPSMRCLGGRLHHRRTISSRNPGGDGGTRRPGENGGASMSKGQGHRLHQQAQRLQMHSWPVRRHLADSA